MRRTTPEWVSNNMRFREARFPDMFPITTFMYRTEEERIDDQLRREYHEKNQRRMLEKDYRTWKSEILSGKFSYIQEKYNNSTKEMNIEEYANVVLDDLTKLCKEQNIDKEIIDKEITPLTSEEIENLLNEIQQDLDKTRSKKKFNNKKR